MTSFSCALSRYVGTLRRQALPAAALLLLSACGGLGEAMSAHTDVVARAAGKELRVDEAAQIIAANAEIPPDPEVVRAVADLWVDYALLATAVAEDTALTAVDMEAFIQPVREQALVSMLREQVISPDTTFDDAELERRWAMEGPGAEIRARHILLRTPTSADEAQRDSVEQLAESLRARAEAGESFEELAGEYSEDPGSAARGGDLGFFSRGRMVQPFEEVAFELEPGEVSPVVETPFGYHVILLEERRQPEMGDERGQFREYLVQQSLEQSETAYLDSLAAVANVEIPTSDLGVVREIAGRPERELSGRQADRPIATYDGGAYTAGEFATFVRTQPPQVQSAFVSATDEQLETAVTQLVQMELLLAQVTEHGISLATEEEERIRREGREMIRQLIEATGFGQAARQGADAAALDEHVNTIVRGTVTGEQPFVPLGRLGLSLRDLYSHEINEAAFSDVVTQLEQIRAQQPPAESPAQQPGAPALPQMPGDSVPATPPPPETPGTGQE
ncbi:MAG: peptidylprolyl isomerase [Gemmatimonadota bacterium]